VKNRQQTDDEFIGDDMSTTGIEGAEGNEPDEAEL
jgi:hypothetical protein